MPPLVSIITPVLNRASTMRACLTSVAKQTYPATQHIIVDGGSTDGTLEILRGLPRSASTHWISEPDAGMYDAINKGLRIAEGDIVCYLNSDDLYFPWSIEVAVDTLSGGADLIFGDLAVLQHDAGGLDFYVQFYPDFDLIYYTHVATIGQPTVFWRRSLTSKIGYFDTSYRLIGDCDYWLRAGLAGARIRHVDEVLAVQLEHAETLRARHAEHLEREFDRLRQRYAGSIRPPISPGWQRLRHSLFWRKRQLQFRTALRQRHPERWPRFVGAFRRRGVTVDDVGFLFALLPQRIRPRSPWGNARELERKLMDEIGA